MNRLHRESLVDDLVKLGLCKGDVVLIRANLGSVGKIIGGAETFIDALLEAIGPDGTVVSLAFTEASFFRRAKKENAFNLKKKSYAGALPNAMIDRNDSFRSSHPMCSYVAIGKFAKEITSDHNEKSAAYEPIRKIVNLGGKNLLVGCVATSPGFTTTHLAEMDLGMLRQGVFSKLFSTYYLKDDGEYTIFRRSDLGLCSKSFYKFYAHYVRNGILRVGFIGDAYSILASARDCYEIELDILKKNKKFNICDSKYCFTCNANRWDRIYCLPGFAIRFLIKKLKNKIH